MAEARGAADALALKLRHHDAALHASARAAAVATTATRARCSMRSRRRGSRRSAHASMDGVRANLVDAGRSAGADRCDHARAHRGGSAAGDRGRAARAAAADRRGAARRRRAPALALVAPWIEEKAGAELDALALTIDDQAAFATLSRRLLEDLELADADEPADEAARGRRRRGARRGRRPRRGGRRRGRRRRGGRRDGNALRQEERDDGEERQPERARQEEGEASDRRRGRRAGAGQPVAAQLAGRADQRLSPYTTRFDEMVEAAELCDEEELNRLRAYLDQQMSQLQGVVTRLANRLQRRLMAQQARSWDFDQEEGMLDAARLARVIVSPGAFAELQDRARDRIQGHGGHPADRQFRDRCAGGRSRSPRPAPTSWRARSSGAGSRPRFSASRRAAWKGGQSREAWLAEGRPPQPGRLNDLRHIVYKRADEPYRHARRNLGLMMREGLLKENIDGEALLWAHNRLLARPEERRILMVISRWRAGRRFDRFGQWRHLSGKASAAGDRLDRDASTVELAAIGIGHDVTRYY